MDAHAIVEFLNDYFARMVDVVFAEKGVLDKFIGDAILAEWGVPFPSPHEDPFRACRAALGMLRALSEINAERLSRGLTPVEIGIGIHSGEAISGNIGSPRRFEYTCIGDAVNLASRLEGATKSFHVPVLISEQTRAVIGTAFIVRELDTIRVVGKRKSLTVFELCGVSTEPLPSWRQQCNETYAAALAEFRKRKFEAARLLCLQALEQSEQLDGPSRTLLNRIETFLKVSPASDWDGIWDLDHK
jgi:adenylate cyclase